MIKIEVVKARGGPRTRDNIDHSISSSQVQRLVSRGVNKAKVILNDYRTANVSVEFADKFIKEFPEKCNKNLLRVANDTISISMVRHVIYRGRVHVQVMLKNGKREWLSRKYADALGITAYNYLENSTDQPWSDRTIHDDIDNLEVVQVIRRGRNKARVLLIDGSRVLISREKCNQIDIELGTSIGILKPNTKKDVGFSMVEE